MDNFKKAVAARTGDTKKASALIKADADVNVKDEYGKPLLMYAARDGRAETGDLQKRAGAKE